MLSHNPLNRKYSSSYAALSCGPSPDSPLVNDVLLSSLLLLSVLAFIQQPQLVWPSFIEVDPHVCLHMSLDASEVHQHIIAFGERMVPAGTRSKYKLRHPSARPTIFHEICTIVAYKQTYIMNMSNSKPAPY